MYAPHVALDDKVKKIVLEDLDEIVISVPINERIFIGGDLNRH